jgi:low affinity Fe/Cu permease
MKRTPEHVSNLMERLAIRTTESTGSSWAFIIALTMTVLWLVSGPFFGYTDTWQLAMNTVSSIVTFLMVFLLQRSQNKDTLAIQLKLNELIATQKGASNRLINVEELTEQEVRALHERYEQLSAAARDQNRTRAPLSIEQTGASQGTEK